MPDSLREPDPLIKVTRQAFENPRYGYYGESLDRERMAGLRVSQASLSRGLRVLNTIIKHARLLGYEVILNDEYRGGESFLRIEGQRVPFVLREKTRQKKEVVYPGERYSYNRTTCVPTGRFELRIAGYGSYLPRRTWRDTERQRVEDFIGNLLVARYRQAVYTRRRAEENARQEQQRALESQAELERQRVLAAEAARLRQLEEQAERWHRSRMVLDFIAEVERRAIAAALTLEEQDAVVVHASGNGRHEDSSPP